MTTGKKQFPKVLSPVGIGAYVWVVKPDTGHQFSDNKFKLTLVIDQNDEAAMAGVEKIEEVCREAARMEWGKVPDDLKTSIIDGNNGDKEDYKGKTTITFKSQYKPGVVDAKLNPLPSSIEVRSGDLVRVSGVCWPYTSTERVKVKGKTVIEEVRGVSLRLRSVQLLEKRSMSGNAADDFDEMEGYDGFDASDEDLNNDTDADDSADF